MRRANENKPYTEMHLKSRFVIGQWAVLMGILMVFTLDACIVTQPKHETRAWSCESTADSAVTAGQWHQALASHQKVLKENPHNCLALYHLGYIWGKLGDRTQEAAHYEKAVQCGYIDDESLYFNLGMAYGDMHQMDRALASFERAVKLNPINADNHFGMGLIARASGKSAIAEKALVQAVTLDPHHWDAHTLLARIYLNQGRLDDARRHLDIVLKSHPENQEAIELWQVLQDRLATSFDHWK